VDNPSHRTVYGQRVGEAQWLTNAATIVSFSSDVFVNTTTEFLSNSSKSESPFFLFLSFTSPHAGGIGTNAETGVPAPYDTPQYVNQSWPKVERDFASVITLQDQQVGQIVKELDSLGLGNDTVSRKTPRLGFIATLFHRLCSLPVTMEPIMKGVTVTSSLRAQVLCGATREVSTREE
jgi:hypothetical protein